MLITKDSCSDDQLEEFINKTRKIGYRDHKEIKQLEIDETINNKWGKFFYTFKNEKIISLSGCHEFTHFDVENLKWIDGMRVCFRGVQLPGEDTYKGISKHHMNSIPFREHLPLQMEWGKALGYNHFFITTHNWYGTPANLYKGPSKEQNRTNKIMKYLSKLNIVIHHGESYVKGYLQNIWEINQDEYLGLRSLTKNQK
jgi:hypothetical protein